MEKKEQLYEGKAKKVYATEDPELLIVSYKDDATAFNGLKKGQIAGRVVLAAKAPARWAAMPAAAIMTPKPWLRAFRAKLRASSGVRWAENMCTSWGTPYSASLSAAFSATGRSLSLPMMMATFFI